MVELEVKKTIEIGFARRRTLAATVDARSSFPVQQFAKRTIQVFNESVRLSLLYVIIDPHFLLFLVPIETVSLHR